MMKRLMLSLLTIGVVAGALTYGVYAYFFDGATSAVSVTAANGVDLQFDIDKGCDGSEVLGAEVLPPVTVTDLYPGDIQSACVTVNNASGTDLNVYVSNANFADDVGGTFLAVLQGRVVDLTGNSTPCAFNGVDSATYTTANGGRGCLLFNLGPGAARTIQVDLKFFDNGSDQSALANANATWNSSINGYTTP